MLLNWGVGEDFRGVPWTARRSNQSILKEISPEYSLEGLTLKLKLQYFGHLMRRVDSLENTLMLGRIWGRRRGQQRMRWLDGITDSVDISLWTPGVGDGQGGLACCDSWGRKESDKTERLDWTELNWIEVEESCVQFGIKHNSSYFWSHGLNPSCSERIPVKICYFSTFTSCRLLLLNQRIKYYWW